MHKILIGDALTQLKTLPDNSINCVVTSPPYWGLRNYGVDGQIGLEPTFSSYVEAITTIFREVRRVLRDDGTLWLNLGDSRAGSGRGGNPDAGLKPKNIIGIPWRVAFALQADGWFLRQDIIWVKPNPMPESVKDRCTTAHEYLFLLSKSAKYYFEPIKEPAVAQKGNAKSFRGGGKYTKGQSVTPDLVARESHGNIPNETGVRNRHSVWTIYPQPFKEAHFATFPPSLVEPCLLAGCPPGGIVLDPFGGSGTTALVAKQLNRHCVLIELNPEYAAMAERRLALTRPPK